MSLLSKNSVGPSSTTLDARMPMTNTLGGFKTCLGCRKPFIDHNL